jgi:endonuclease
MPKNKKITTRVLIAEWANKNMRNGEVYEKNEFVERLVTELQIKPSQASRELYALSVNCSRKSLPSINPNSGHDLFYKVERAHFRLWDRNRDPAPNYHSDI